MSKPRMFGLVVLACGALVGLITGRPFGLVFAAVCLVVGLVLLVAYEAMGTKQKRGEPKAGHLGRNESAGPSPGEGSACPPAT